MLQVDDFGENRTGRLHLRMRVTVKQRILRKNGQAHFAFLEGTFVYRRPEKP